MEELIKKTDTEISECMQKQRDLCKEKGYPHFAPNSGICWRCNKNIYQNYKEIDGRVSHGESGEEHIIGCPHCNRSYCD